MIYFMARRNRELYPEQYFHFISRGINNIFLFKGTEDFQKYLGIVHCYFKQFYVQCFHYVVMNTHSHFIVRLPEQIERIPDMMKVIHQKYSWYYHFKYKFDGGLWRDRYKSELIDTDRYMLGCGLYIEYNPVKAGVAHLPEEYPWSSYAHWIGKRKDSILSEHPLDVVRNYKEIAQDYIDAYSEYIKLTSISVGRPKKSY